MFLVSIFSVWTGVLSWKASSKICTVHQNISHPTRQLHTHKFARLADLLVNLNNICMTEYKRRLPYFALIVICVEVIIRIGAQALSCVSFLMCGMCRDACVVVNSKNIIMEQPLHLRVKCCSTWWLFSNHICSQASTPHLDGVLGHPQSWWYPLFDKNNISFKNLTGFLPFFMLRKTIGCVGKTLVYVELKHLPDYYVCADEVHITGLHIMFKLLLGPYPLCNWIAENARCKNMLYCWFWIGHSALWNLGWTKVDRNLWLLKLYPSSLSYQSQSTHRDTHTQSWELFRNWKRPEMSQKLQILLRTDGKKGVSPSQAP